MMTFNPRKLILGVAAVAALFAAPAAQAEMMKFTAALTGASEVPQVDSVATGTAEVTLDTEAKTVSWVYTVDGLSGPMTASHIHGPASPTEAAGPVIDTGADTLEGSAPITDEQAADLTAGKYYVNFHSEKYPDGEIRGQLALMQ
jgi:hypothetical protein